MRTNRDSGARLEVYAARRAREWLAADPARYVGSVEDWHLSPEEEHVFAIKRERFPVMACAMLAYEAFKGFVTTDAFGGADVWYDAWNRFPQWKRRRRPDPKEFAGFAAHFFGLSEREADAMFWKQHFYEVREGYR